MKFTIAYYLMLLYCSVMFKPLIPIISDVIAHNFADAEHIATVHMVYGADHVEKELATTSSESNNNKNQNTAKQEEQSTVHISADECQYEFSFYNDNNPFPFFKLSYLTDIYISNQAPPPKVA